LLILVVKDAAGNPRFDKILTWSCFIQLMFLLI